MVLASTLEPMVKPAAPEAAPPALTRRPVRARAPLGPVRRVVREVGLGLVTLGLVTFLFVAYQLWGTGFTERHDQIVLQRQFQSLGHAASAPRPVAASAARATPTTTANPAAGGELSPSTPIGTAIDHLVIPAISVNKYVVQGTAENDLMQGPGHYLGTPMPGERGNAGIAGHRTTYGAPFFQLGHLRKGDWIYLTDTANHTFDYRVVGHEVVPPSDVSVLDPTRWAQLTLTTCNPPYSATSRLVVIARLVGRPAATPPAPAPATPAAVAAPGSRDVVPLPAALPTSLGTGNANAWGPAVGFGALAAALWVLTRVAIARRRGWRKAPVLVAGLVVCAAPLWFCFQNVVRLLPPSV